MSQNLSYFFDLVRISAKNCYNIFIAVKAKYLYFDTLG